jgi:hypothetical protein
VPDILTQLQAKLVNIFIRRKVSFFPIFTVNLVNFKLLNIKNISSHKKAKI